MPTLAAIQPNPTRSVPTINRPGAPGSEAPHMPVGVLRTDEIRHSLARALRAAAGRTLADELAGLYQRFDVERRIGLLAQLLKSVGPMAALALAGGVFAKFAIREDWRNVSVSVDDAMRISAAQVHALVRYVEQADPGLFDQVANLLSQDLTAMSLLSGSLLALALAELHRRWGKGAGPARH